MNFPSVNPALARTLVAREYLEPTAVQAAVLQPETAGRDLLVSAQTGSGKTVAYGLAFAPTLLGADERFPARSGAPLALIIAPTRELAMQVQAELTWLYADTGAKIVCCVGGMDARAERRLLANGCHIVVGTPGRLRDHIERTGLDVSELKVVVLDEADEMLDLGFREDLEFMLDSTPRERRTMLFSATIPREIADLARRFQDNALRIDTLVRNQAHEDIDYKAIRIGAADIERAVINVLRFYDAKATLVFCATRDAVRNLHISLQKRGFDAVCLSGELSQEERNAALQALRDGRARICVATDVAARGLDLPDLGLVVHADLPTNKETLTHRSGRTGRAGKKGICVLLVPHPKRRRAELLLASANIRAAWSGAPTAAEIRDLDRERLLADPILSDPASDDDLALGRLLLDRSSPEHVAAALIRLYRSQLPEAQDVADVTPVQERREEVRSYKNTERAAPAIREKHARPVNTTWFSLNVGRHGNADPKWILPLVCRLGNVTKAEIGAIRIFDTETKFELAWDSVSGFLASVGASGETEIIFERTTPANQAPPRSGKYGPQRPEGAVTPRAFAKPGARPYVKPTGPKPFNAAKPRRAKG
ncbi:MAG: DEAD/DEAH box helicase [Rhodospirillales bacterium]